MFDPVHEPGEAVRTEEVVKKGIQALQAQAVGRSLRTLTGREYNVAILLARCMTVRDIARELGASEKTIRNHISKIYGKLNCCSHVAIVVHVFSAGWEPVPDVSGSRS